MKLESSGFKKLFIMAIVLGSLAPAFAGNLQITPEKPKAGEKVLFQYF